MFFKGSRYANVGDLTMKGPGGREIKYKKTRLIPPAGAQAGHLVHQGERLDHIAQRYYRDPERFWRIADANQVLWPDELVEQAGRIILIPPSEG
ncbi:MAG: LysM peptidoglycan-binding domain-containing protein [Bryobacteraceae bacterium]|nr:LysM peptidoglycan-binding domain-containing protein [Bryobacteraceae bacterium]